MDNSKNGEQSKCSKGWELLAIINDKGEIDYICPVPYCYIKDCDYFPDK